MRIIYHHRTRATDAQRVHIREIIQAFRRLGHEVEVIALADAEKPQQDASAEATESVWKKIALRVPLAYELMQLAYNAVATPWLVWRIWRGRVDFIYERYSVLNFAGVLAAKLTRCPIVLEVNSPFAIEQVEEKEIRAARFSAWMERHICNAATKAIVVSGPLRDIMIRSGVEAQRLVVMHNGVNVEHLNSGPSHEELRTSLGLQGKTVIGFTGWFRKWHGLEFLVEAFAKARLAERNAALLLVGDGPAMADVKERVETHGLNDAVVLAGPVAHENIAPYLRAFDIAVQPAANAYCCPMKILEYMGLGKAIVAPRQDNITELLGEGHEGELFTPGDVHALGEALRKLVENPAERSRLGTQALRSVYQRGLLWTNNAEASVRLVRRPCDSSSGTTAAVMRARRSEPLG